MGIIRIPSASRTDSLQAHCTRRSSVGTQLDDCEDRLGTGSTELLEKLMLAGDFDATKRGQVETSSSLARANPEPRRWSCWMDGDAGRLRSRGQIEGRKPV